MVSNYRKLTKSESVDNALRMITRSMYENQKTEKPITDWPPIDESRKLQNTANKVGHIMSTKVLTVKEKELADMAISIMQWKNIHHVPVENSSGKLCGLLTWTHAQKFRNGNNDTSYTVEKIMAKDIITVSASTTIKKAISIMKKNEIGCLPVTQDKELVGIITIQDVIPFYHD